MGKRKYFSTGIYLHPGQWDNRRKKIRRHPNADALNKRITDYIYLLEELELNLWQQEKKLSLETFKNAIKRKSEKHQFTSFYLRETMSATIKNSTRHNHLTTWKKLNEFNEKIQFEEINYKFLVDFESFLYQSGCQVNTVAKHMRHLKRYINLALNKGYSNIEPHLFQKYLIKLKDVAHCFLLPEELYIFENLSSKFELGKLQFQINQNWINYLMEFKVI